MFFFHLMAYQPSYAVKNSQNFYIDIDIENDLSENVIYRLNLFHYCQCIPWNFHGDY